MADALPIVWKILMTWTFLMSLGFCLYYSWIARWSMNEFGRSLMIYQIAMTVVLGYAAITSFLDGANDLIPVQLVGIVTFAVVPLALTWRLIVLIKIKREVQNGSGDHQEI